MYYLHYPSGDESVVLHFDKFESFSFIQESYAPVDNNLLVNVTGVFLLFCTYLLLEIAMVINLEDDLC